MKLTTRLIWLFVAILFSCRTPLVPRSGEQKFYTVQSITQDDSVSEIAQYLRPFRDSVQQEMNIILGLATENFVKEKPSGSLCNLVSDAMFWAALRKENTVSAAISNYGGLRLPQLAKGEIRLGTIFELLPFENELVLIEVPGNILIQWSSLIIQSEGWPISHMSILSNQDKIITQVSNSNTLEEIKDEKKYWIATNDYVANGGDNCSFLKDLPRIETKILVREALIQYLKDKKNITPDKQARIKIYKP